MPVEVSAGWADGISSCLRQLISAGANDKDISRYLNAISTGDKVGASNILKRLQATSTTGEHRGVECILERVRVTALRPVANSLDAEKLQHFMNHLIHISTAVVEALKEQPFWSVDAAVDAVADVVRSACLDLSSSDPNLARAGEPSAPIQAHLERVTAAVETMATLLSKEDLSLRLGWPIAKVDRALSSRSMFAVETDGIVLIPSIFSDPRYGGPQLRAVCRILGDLPAGSKWQFFTSPRASLGARTPLELLAERQFSIVKAAARGFREG